MLNYGLAVLSGLLLFLIHPRFEWTWLAPVALVPLLLALKREPSVKGRALLGLATGSVHWAGMCYWIHFVMSVHGGLGNLGGAVVFLLFCLGCALGTAVFAMLAAPLLKWAYGVWGVAALWSVNEWVPAPYGFTWLGIGDAALDWGIGALAPWTGVYGLTFVLALINAAIVRRRAALVLVPLVVFVPFPRHTQPPDHEAVVLQPNIPTEKEWTDDEVIELGRRLEYLTVQQAVGGRQPAVLIWPEVPAPLYFDSDVRFRDRAVSIARLSRVPFLFGTVGHTAQREPLNSALLVRSDGAVADRYSKIELVPFGEYVPPPFASIVPRITSEISDFVPGSKLTTFDVAGREVSAFICYESAFPNLVRRFNADLLVNMSNDGYFGKHAAREQHLKLVRMRALENGRWILRATNDGMTVSIDPAGKIVKSLQPYEQLAARLPFRYISASTLYRQWGDWAAYLCIVIAAVSYAVLRGHPRP